MKTYIRLITEKDYNDIISISSKIWEGQDYIPNVFYEWIQQGNFYGFVLNNRVIGISKITILPCKVAWLEGLRMHPDYQNRGYGEKLAQFIFERAIELKKRGIIDCIEYSTYYKNFASLHIGQKAGFKIIERFYSVYKQIKQNTKNIIIKKDKICFDDIKHINRHISIGWRFFKICNETVEWINNNCDVYNDGDCKFFIKKNNHIINLINCNTLQLERIVEIASYTVNNKHIEILIPEKENQLIKKAIQMGFDFFDTPKDVNIYLLRYN